MDEQLDLAGRSIEDDGFFEWLLSDHPAAAEERVRRRRQHAGARAGLRALIRQLTDEWDPSISDQLFSLREKAGRYADPWAVACDDVWSAQDINVQTVRSRLVLVRRDRGEPSYRYPSHYVGEAAVHHLPPPAPQFQEAEPHAEQEGSLDSLPHDVAPAPDPDPTSQNGEAQVAQDDATILADVSWKTFNRVGQLANGDFLFERFGVARARVTPKVQIRPGDRLVAIGATEHGHVAWQARWGVSIDDTAAAAPAPAALVATIHAETALSDASIAAAARTRRAIVPVSFVYGFTGDDGAGAPIAITRADRDVLSIAAVGDAGGDVALLTVPSDSAMRAVEARMPLILELEEEDQWLDHELSADDLASILGRRRSSAELQIRR